MIDQLQKVYSAKIEEFVREENFPWYSDADETEFIHLEEVKEYDAQDMWHFVIDLIDNAQMGLSMRRRLEAFSGWLSGFMDAWDAIEQAS